MRSNELLDRAATVVPGYRQTIFKAIVIAFCAGGCPGRISDIFRRFAMLLASDATIKRFYNLLNSSKLPWDALWGFLVGQIGDPTVAERLLIALDDTTYGKTGKKIAVCGNHFDHAAKQNSAKWVFGHCRVLAGRLFFVHGRWACLPFAQKPYLPLPKAVKAGRKLPREEWLKTKSGIEPELVIRLIERFKRPALIVCDSWFGALPLIKEVREKVASDIHMLSRLLINAVLYDFPVIVSGKERMVEFSEIERVSKALGCQVKVVFVYYKGFAFPLIATDLALTAEQMIEFYSARWKIESGFKEIKQDIGAIDSQCRKPLAVENHFDLCCFAMSLTWVYAFHLEHAPDRRPPGKHAGAFAFADIRRKISDELSGESILPGSCPEGLIPAIKFVCASLFRCRMTALPWISGKLQLSISRTL